MGYATGLKIQRIQELGLQIPVAVCSLYTLNKYIRPVGVTTYIIEHPQILVGILEGEIKSNFGPDTELSSSLINNFYTNLGMNGAQIYEFLKGLISESQKNGKK